MTPKNFILIFFIAFLTYCYTFGKLNMNYKELFAEDLVIKDECKNESGDVDWECYFEKNPKNLDLASCTSKDEEGNDVIDYYCDKLWYTRKKLPCLSELSNENLVYENDLPKTKLIMKIDDNSLKEFISKEWDAKNEIDFSGKQIVPKECVDPGNDGTEQDVINYGRCIGLNEGKWIPKKQIDATNNPNPPNFYYDNILRIFPKKKNRLTEDTLINNLDPYLKTFKGEFTDKKKLQDFNKLKYNTNLDSDYLKDYAKIILKDNDVKMNNIFWDTNNITNERLNTDDYKFGNGIKYVKSDFEDADKYAYAKLCLSKGYCLSYDDEGNFTCQFDKKQCLDRSKKEADVKSFEKDEEGKPTDKKPKYEYHEWRKDIGCINGNENIKDFCTKKNQCNYRDGYWSYDSSNGKCKITKLYCESLGLELRDGKCKTAEGQLLQEGLVGQTFTRNGRRIDNGSAQREGRQCPPYKVEYKRLMDSKDPGEDNQKFISACLDPDRPSKNEEDYYNVFDRRDGGESDFAKYGKYIPYVGGLISMADGR